MAVSRGTVFNEKAFDAVLLNLNINTSLGNSHNYTTSDVEILILLSLEELESVELHGCLTGLLRHSILPVHLITLLGQFELIGHIIRKTRNINSSSEEPMNQNISIPSNRRSEMGVKFDG